MKNIVKDFDLQGCQLNPEELFELDATHIEARHALDFIGLMHRQYYPSKCGGAAPGCVSRWLADGTFEFVTHKSRVILSENPELAPNEVHALCGGAVFRVHNLSWREKFSLY